MGGQLRTAFGRLLREPLAHFLLIGLALFALYAWLAPPSLESSQVTVSRSEVDVMVRQFETKWRRKPTQAELDGLVETWVRDEILYREGLAMGLDRGDSVVKRRLRQKYELIAEEGRRSAPTEADLSAFLKSHPAAFAGPASIGFDQVYFDPSLASPEEVAAALSAIAKGADPAAFGHPSMLPREAAATPLDRLAGDYGPGFADRLAAAPVGQWIGPIPSGLGVHLVRVTARDTPEAPPLAEVRTAVAREWESDQRRRARDEDYRKLRANYDVVIEGGGAGSSGK